MKAVQLQAWQNPPRLVEVPVPKPGPGQVLLRIGAAGVCHMDLHLVDWPAGTLPYQLPFTLGHEAAGWVEALGPGATGFSVGDPVAVYGPWGCGLCRNCARGMENYCLRAAELVAAGGGLGRDGAMAEYMLVPSPRLLVPLGTFDPIDAAPLTDAALTSYHAIKHSLGKLVPGSSAVVIGAGGLGHMAIQLLKALTSAQIYAIDTAEDKRTLALEVGAALVFEPNQRAIEVVRAATRGVGAELVLDFVGADSTLALAAKLAAVDGDLAIVGLAGGTFPIKYGTVPLACSARIPYWGTRDELIDVLALAEQGAIRVHIERFPLDAFGEVYDRLRHGALRGRAVLLPHG